ncbi:60S ribosomal protein L10-like [Delphinapterus leucas]|uniref:60S ribosomal protein L10-like n=1 Tax=Delphinapterus leucas TaxID=9749 RepID=A0A7F8KAP8_DELLE|nr:60S ribosomal protein L10-like [Delphinapterus leucas]
MSRKERSELFALVTPVARLEQVSEDLVVLETADLTSSGGSLHGCWEALCPLLRSLKPQALGVGLPEKANALLRRRSCHLSQSRLQTGMRGAFGKPQGTVARVHIGQVIMSIRTKLQNKEHVIEALHRAKFKFPGRQKIHISKKWGFTKFNADEFENMVAEKQLIPDGCGVKYIPNRGPLDKWRALHS